MSWYNNDGLYVRFGTEKVVSAVGGESVTDGNNRVLTFDFDYTDLAAFGTEKILSEGVTIPDGAFIKSAVLTVLTPFDSALDTATLTVGLIDSDRTTAYDADGLDVAIAQTAIDAEGDEVVMDGAAVGAVVDNTVPVYITTTVGTEDFTAGAAQLVVTYFIP